VLHTVPLAGGLERVGCEARATATIAVKAPGSKRQACSSIAQRTRSQQRSTTKHVRNTWDAGPHRLVQIRKNAALLRRGEIVAQINCRDEQCTRWPEPLTAQFINIATRVSASTTLYARATITAEARSPVRRLRSCGRVEQ
jgi:hypothetical protein